MKLLAKLSIPQWLTIAVFAIVVAVLWSGVDFEKLNQIGGFIGGVAGALAFIWLVAAYHLQNHELQLQRAELALQRESLDAQRDELKKMGKYAALDQMAKILSQFEQSLAKSNDGVPKTVNELQPAFMDFMRHWNVIFKSTDNNEVFDLFMRWKKIVEPCKEFVARVVSAIELYEEAIGEKKLGHIGSPQTRLYFGGTNVRDIPFVRNYIGTAELIATQLFLYEPGLDRLELKGLQATDALMPGIVNQGELERLKERVAVHDSWNKAQTQTG